MTTWRVASIVTVASFVACVGRAQTIRDDRAAAEVIERDLQQKQRKLTEAESLLQRLEELRVRHALGLSVAADSYLEVPASELAMLRERGKDTLVAAETEVRRLSMQAEELTQQCDAARADLRQLAESASSGEATDQPRPLTRRVDVPRFDDFETARPARPGGETVRPRRPDPVNVTEKMDDAKRGGQPKAPVDPMDGSPKIIVGSLNHSDVGRVLVQSADDAMQRSKLAADAEERSRLEARAKALLESARRELEPLSKAKSPELIDLFYLARCEEKLGNVAAADSLYAQIISLDQEVDESGQEAYGTWGRAAQAAKSVLRWVTDTGDWKPALDVERLQWNNK